MKIVDKQGKEVMDGVKGLLLFYGNTVCDDNFDDNAANAVCQKMGYPGSVTWSTEQTYDFQMELSITHMQCNDNGWSSCSFSNAGNCGHSEDVFIRCIVGKHHSKCLIREY